MRNLCGLLCGLAIGLSTSHVAAQVECAHALQQQARAQPSDGCCWPGQRWDAANDRCSGVASQCPEGWTLNGADCLAPPSEPDAASESESADAAEEYRQRAADIDERLDRLLDIPVTPAAFAVGVSDEVVVHPATLREAVGALTSFIGPDGNLRAGVAAEVAPVRIARGPQPALGDDVGIGLGRFADSIRLSIATAQPTGNVPGVLAAFGVRASPVDDTDWRYNRALVVAVRNALLGCVPGQPILPGGGGGANPVDAPECAGLDDALEQLFTQAINEGHRVELAATTALFTDPMTGNATWSSTHAWAAWEYRGAIVDTTGYEFGAGARYVASTPLLGSTDSVNHDASGGVRIAVHGEGFQWSLGATLDYFAELTDGRMTDDRPVFRGSTSLAFDVEALFTIRGGVVLSFNETPDEWRAQFLLALALAGEEESIVEVARSLP